MTYAFTTMHSPVGLLKLVASENGLAAVLWEGDSAARVRLSTSVYDGNNKILVETEKQLCEYFTGKRKDFLLPLDFVGTEFQKKVWHALLAIPYGETRTYGQLATSLNNDKAVRAVGAANGKNPISIIAPCHRVIGATGALTGFAGGLKNKAILLELEKGVISLPL